MREQHNGFVLLIVLVYLQLIALLNIANIKQLTMLKKQIKHQHLQSILQAEASVILNNIVDKGAVTCQRQLHPVRFLQMQPLSWWQSYGCMGESISGHYYYFINDMGVDDCTVIENRINQSMSAHYYRVTMMLDAMESIIAQETLITSEQRSGACTQQNRVVQAGKGPMRWL